MESFLGFMGDLAAASARAAWADLGTNGLGWIVGFGNPVLVAISKATHAPKDQKIANVLSQWKTELRDVAVVYVAIGAMVFSVEMIWRQPQRIRTDAAAIARPSPHELLLPPPELPVPAPPRLSKPQLPRSAVQPQIVLQQPVGNLPERAMAVANDIMTDLYRHGWHDDHGNLHPPIMEEQPQHDPEKEIEWSSDRSRHFRVVSLPSVIELRDDFVKVNIENPELNRFLQFEGSANVNEMINPLEIQGMAEWMQDLATQGERIRQLH